MPRIFGLRHASPNPVFLGRFRSAFAPSGSSDSEAIRKSDGSGDMEKEGSVGQSVRHEGILNPRAVPDMHQFTKLLAPSVEISLKSPTQPSPWVQTYHS